jgi:hypothetical protein
MNTLILFIFYFDNFKEKVGLPTAVPLLYHRKSKVNVRARAVFPLRAAFLLIGRVCGSGSGSAAGKSNNAGPGIQEPAVEFPGCFVRKQYKYGDRLSRIILLIFE